MRPIQGPLLSDLRSCFPLSIKWKFHKAPCKCQIFSAVRESFTIFSSDSPHPRSLWKDLTFGKSLESSTGLGSVQTFAEENIVSQSLRERSLTRDHSGTSRSFICNICQEGFVKRYYASSHVMTLHQVGTFQSCFSSVCLFLLFRVWNTSVGDATQWDTLKDTLNYNITILSFVCILFVTDVRMCVSHSRHQ